MTPQVSWRCTNMKRHFSINEANNNISGFALNKLTHTANRHQIIRNEIAAHRLEYFQNIRFKISLNNFSEIFDIMLLLRVY